jgi:hypothetical protein
MVLASELSSCVKTKGKDGTHGVVHNALIFLFYLDYTKDNCISQGECDFQSLWYRCHIEYSYYCTNDIQMRKYVE